MTETKEKRRKINISKLEKYKWEFLRRNKEYRKAYDSYIKKSPKKKDGEELASEWWILEPLDYSKTYEEVIRFSGSRELFLPYYLKIDLGKGHDANCPLISGGFLMDISYPKELIIEAFKEHLTNLINTHKKSKGLYRKPKIRDRVRVETYKTYLEVYDLREKKKLKWRQVAEKKYGKNYHYYAIKTLMRQYESCKELIANYRRIV